MGFIKYLWQNFKWNVSIWKYNGGLTNLLALITLIVIGFGIWGISTLSVKVQMTILVVCITIIAAFILVIIVAVIIEIISWLRKQYHKYKEEQND